MDLYNSKTRKKEDINDPQALQDALRSKTHSYEVGTEIPALNPYGEKVWIKSDEVHDKVALGYRIPTHNEQEVDKYVEANKGPLAALGVGAAQFVDEAALGLPELIYNKTQSPLDVAKKEALKKEHGLANAIGGTAGFLGSMFTGGPLFRASSKVGQAVTRNIADKLAISAADTVSKRAINAASRTLARTAGMGVEGAVISSPHAITELALGDPQAAAEHLLAGATIGALFGGSTGLAKEAWGLGKKVSSDIQKNLADRAVSIKKISRQMARVWTGVPEEKFEYYLNNKERVNNAKPRDVLFDEIDAVTSKVANEIDNLKLAVKEKEYETNQAYQNARRDLQQAKTPQSIADDIALSLENLKPIMGTLSKQADEALANIPGGISPDAMIALVKKAKSDYVPVMVGEKTKGVANKLNTLEKDLIRLKHSKNLTPEKEIPYPTVRDIIQQVREDIDWSPLAAEFNTRLNKANKSFTEALSTIVKNDNPEYARIMSQMKNIADVHEEMVTKGFADRSKGASIFDKIVKKGSDIDTALIEKYDSITGTKFANELKKYSLNRILLEKSARKDMKRVFTPDLYAEVMTLKQRLADAEKFYEPMSMLSRDRILPAMQNLDRKRPNLLIERAFQYLDDVTGKDFRQQVEDRNVLDMFLKEDKAGSRKTALSTAVTSGLGSLVGLGVAGPVGLVGGAVAGATLDVYGGQLLKMMVDKNPSVAGLLFVEKAMKVNADKIDKIPGILSGMSEMVPKKIAPSTAAISALWRILETTDTEHHKHDHKSLSGSTLKISEISERITALLTDPHLLQEHLSQITEGLTNGGAPEIASAFVMTSQKVLQYIDSIIPKPPTPSSPFERRIPWKPADYQIFAFAQKLQVLEDPFMVLGALEDGTLTKNHMEALHTVFPEIFKEIQKKVAQVATSGAATGMNYDKRMKMSLLLGLPLDRSLTSERLKSLQATFEQGQQPDQGNPPPNGFKADIHPRYSRGQQTQFQQLENVGK